MTGNCTTIAQPRWLWRQLLLACCVSIFLLAPLAGRPTPSVLAETRPYNTAQLVATTPGIPIEGIATDGTILVWLDPRGALYTRTLADGRETRLFDNDTQRSQLTLAAKTIVWLERGATGTTVRGVALTGGEPFTIATGPGERTSLTSSGSTLVWRESRGNGWQVVGYDLSSQRPLTFSAAPAARGVIALTEEAVIWEEFRQNHWVLVSHDRHANQETIISSDNADIIAPAADRGVLAYVRRVAGHTAGTLILRDRQSGKEQTITEGNLVLRPSIAGDLLVWEDWRDGTPGIYAFDRASGKSFPLARAEDSRNPVIGGTVVAWVGRGQFSTRITAVRLVKTLPSDPQDPPTVSDPDLRYFPETKHSTVGAFRQFWTANGGLAVFGYPLTEAFEETDPNGVKRQVQYFERAKLEANPQDPKQVALARLGAEMTNGRNFPMVPPFDSTDQRAYFAQTGHSLSGWFLTYWRDHGGVNVFGFPISEEVTENGRLVQYFERARFEVVPDSSDPSSGVALGQIGREALVKLGWLAPEATTQP